jgi:ketosteroid isomerase-like protein
VSEENLAVVRERFEAWRRGDFDAAHASNHPDIELVPDPAWPEPGTYRGDAEVRAFYDRYRDSWGTADEVDWDLLDAGDRVVARFSNRVRGRGSGMEVENRASTVFTLRDGRVTRIEFFFDHDDALRAAGLDPT